MRAFLVSLALVVNAVMFASPANAVEGDAGHSPNVVTYQEYVNADYTMPKWKVHKIFDLQPTFCLRETHRLNCRYPSKHGSAAVFVEYLHYNGNWRVSWKCWNC